VDDFEEPDDVAWEDVQPSTHAVDPQMQLGTGNLCQYEAKGQQPTRAAEAKTPEISAEELVHLFDQMMVTEAPSLQAEAFNSIRSLARESPRLIHCHDFITNVKLFFLDGFHTDAEAQYAFVLMLAEIARNPECVKGDFVGAVTPHLLDPLVFQPANTLIKRKLTTAALAIAKNLQANDTRKDKAALMKRMQELVQNVLAEGVGNEKVHKALKDALCALATSTHSTPMSGAAPALVDTGSFQVEPQDKQRDERESDPRAVAVTGSQIRFSNSQCSRRERLQEKGAVPQTTCLMCPCLAKMRPSILYRRQSSRCWAMGRMPR